MKSWSVAIFIALSSLGATAQPNPSGATDIDVKSAYCAAVLKRNVADMEDAASVYPAGPMRDMGRETAREYADALRRLHAYLGPRLNAIAPDALVAASKRGEQDIEITSSAQKSCALTCKVAEPGNAAAQKYVRCLASCIQQVPAVGRTSTCTPVNWLPE